jgi:hypothetical protein
MEVTMRVLVRAFELGILLTICTASTASADVILIRDGRLVDAGAHLTTQGFPGDDVRTPSVPFAPFAATASQSAGDGVSSAQTVTTQRSSVSSSVFIASGTVDSSATGDGNGEFFNAQSGGSSLFDIEFDVPVPHAFSLTGLMEVDTVGGFPGADGFGEVDVLLTSLQPSSELIVLSSGFRNASGGQVDFAGILPAGRGRFQIEAFTESVSGGSFTRHTPSYDLTFTLTPTPEPGSLFLIGGGLVALARRRLMNG